MRTAGKVPQISIHKVNGKSLQLPLRNIIDINEFESILWKKSIFCFNASATLTDEKGVGHALKL